MDAAGRYIATLLAVIFILLFPLQYVAQSQDEAIRSMLHTYAAKFTDTARQNGVISLDMYEDLEEKLTQAGDRYEVSIEVAHPVSGKEMAAYSPWEDMHQCKTEKVALIASSLQVKTKDCISESNDIRTFSSHSHTDQCYSGHRHTGNCVLSGDMAHPVSVEYRYGTTRSSNNISSTVLGISIYCSKCNNILLSIDGAYNNEPHYKYSFHCYIDYYHYASNGSITKTNYQASGVRRDDYNTIEIREFEERHSFVRGFLDNIYDYISHKPIISKVDNWNGSITTKITDNFMWEYEDLYIMYWFYLSETDTWIYRYKDLPFVGCVYCGTYGENYSCGKAQDNTPVCNQVVTSVTATNPTQNVVQGSNIITTATATYLDGHTGTVNCSSNYNPNKIGTQTVTLTHSGKVGDGKTIGTRTCTTKVTVRSAATLTSIIATPTTQSITRYTDPSFTVRACYNDGSDKIITGYSLSGFDRNTLGLQTVTISYSEYGITKTTKASVIVKNLTRTCSVCETVYELDDQDKDHGCPVCSSTMVGIVATPEYVTVPKGDAFAVTVEAIYRNGSKAIVTGWNSNYVKDIIGIQEVRISYEGFHTYILVNVVDNKVICPICERVYSLQEDDTDGGCPYCSTEVISIEAEPDQLTIEKHQPLNITVTAAFRDGHTEQVTDWSTNLLTDRTGTYDALIMYRNLTDHITVTIKEEGLIQCPYCDLEYSYREHPEGCPVCYHTIVGMEAELRSGGTTVPLKSNLNLQIVLLYQDTHRVLKYSGWTVEGYRPDLLGLQTVMVRYQEFSTNLTIEVVDNPYRVVCPKGHVYYLNEDGSDPGCPQCQNETEKENAIFLFSITYTSQILETLYSERFYYLKQGDYLTIRITKKGASVSSRLQKMFFGTGTGIDNIIYTYGGEVI